MGIGEVFPGSSIARDGDRAASMDGFIAIPGKTSPMPIFPKTNKLEMSFIQK